MQYCHIRRSHMNDALPLHYQITRELRGNLEAGLWKVGDLFPTDKQLMEKYNVSSTTVRRAIYELVKEGWLDRKPGKGTFVKRKMVETLRSLTGFFDEIKAKGMTPSSEVLLMGEIELDEDLLEDVPELKDFEDTKLFHIRKIHKMNDSPVVYLDSYWPIEIGKELKKHDLTSRGMYEILRHKGIFLEKADQIISASSADKDVAQGLKINDNDPILVMRRIVFSGKTILEVSVNRYRSDMYSYRVQLDSSTYGENEGMVIDTLNLPYN